MPSRPDLGVRCQSCGYQSHQPITDCPQCGATMISEIFLLPDSPTGKLFHRLDQLPSEKTSAVMTGTIFDHIVHDQGLPLNRTILFYGGPGLGKSFYARLLMKQLGGIYYSYEERLEIVAAKFKEQGVFDMTRIYLTTAPFCAEHWAIHERHPHVVVIDSLHMAEVGEIEVQSSFFGIKIRERDDAGAPGSPRRLNAVTAEAVKLVREQPATTVILIGHETKDERSAGPRTIEHLVDVVMKLEETEGQRLDHPALPGGLIINKDTMTREIVIEKNRCGIKGRWLV